MSLPHRGTIAGLALGIGIALLAAPAARAADALSIEEKLFAEKCSLCHSSKRIYMMDPVQLKPIVERMRKMNPDWMTTADSDHIVAVLAKLVDDPAAVAGRLAWREAAARGEALFEDEKLGTNGKSCASCHDAKTMKQVADGFPRYDLKLRRLVTLEDVVAMMVRENLAGELPPNSPQMIDLLVYIKSVK